MIRKLLEKNKEFINEYREDNNPLKELVIYFLLALFFLFLLPVFLSLIIINYIYQLYNKLFPINNKKLFNKNLFSYEKNYIK